MSITTVTIIGAGTTGLSWGLALKKSRGEAVTVIGHDRWREPALEGRRLGAFDKVEWNLPNACEQADLAILAVPLSAMNETIGVIAPALRPGAIVTDTARIKQPVCQAAKSLLPAHTAFIGGHPIVFPAGKGAAEASAELFTRRIYCLVTPPETPAPALKTISALVEEIGAWPLFIDAAEHDGQLSGSEDLPVLLAMALLEEAAHTPAAGDILRLAGPSLLAATEALFAEDEESLAAALTANRQNALLRLADLQSRLQELSTWLSGGDEAALLERIKKARAQREDWQSARQSSALYFGETQEIPAPPGLLKRLFGRP